MHLRKTPQLNDGQQWYSRRAVKKGADCGTSAAGRLARQTRFMPGAYRHTAAFGGPGRQLHEGESLCTQPPH